MTSLQPEVNTIIMKNLNCPTVSHMLIRSIISYSLYSLYSLYRLYSQFYLKSTFFTCDERL